MKESFPWQEHNCLICGEARNGEEALEQIDGLKPDIVLADINMPFLNGLEFIERVGKQAANPVFIVISGYSDFLYAKEAIRLGVLGYVLKPVEEEELAAVLKKAIMQIEARAREKKELVYLRAAAEGQCLEPGRRAELTVAVRQLDREKVMSAVEAVFDEDIGKDAGKEAVILTAVELTGLLAGVIKEGILGRHGTWAGEHTDKLPYFFEDCQQIRKYVREVYQYGMVILGREKMSGTVKLILDNLCSHYQEPDLTVERIARDIYLNYYYLCSQFKKETGMTASSFLLSMRMFQAVYLICVKKQSVERAALEVGITDSKYFSRCFKKMFGISPRSIN